MENIYNFKIAGLECTVASDSGYEHTKTIADAVDAKISGILAQNPKTSTMMAAVIACMDYCEEIMTLQSGTENMRAQVKTYLDDMAKTIAERDEARRIIDRLKNEILARNQKEASAQ